MRFKKFTAVRLYERYPQQDVADHEVFMSFTNDADALRFREWWEEQGTSAFGGWLSLKYPKEHQ